MDEMMKKKRPRGVEDVYTEDSGLPPPQDIDGGSAPKPRKPKAYAKGGVTRADGCVTKGHTKGAMVKMARGGMAC
jgi:uncharacterized Fe-S cluster-containing radical SAM superfamily enzyme